MNIIYIHTHDTGRYIQPYGHQVPTPNLMELAESGTLFRQAFSAAPTCSPSRTGLLTGMAPHSAGMLGLAHRGFQLDDYGKHLTQFLNKQGFETVLCGFQHEAPKRKLIGYQKVLDRKTPEFSNKLNNLGKYAHKAAAQLKALFPNLAGRLKEIKDKVDIKSLTDLRNAYKTAEYLKQTSSAPFFLSFGMYSTHRNFPQIDQDTDADYVLPPEPIYDTKETRTDMAKFITSAKIADKCVGIVLEAVREAGLEEDSLILFTTDHGIAFPEMKCTLSDAGMGVSLILNYPGNPKQGEVIDSLVSQLDIFPTICDLARLTKPSWLEGKSMVPLLEDKTEQIRDEIYGEVTFHAAYEPMRCIRTERYKFIKYFTEQGQAAPANIDDGPSKDFFLEADYLAHEPKTEQLYDLYLDPQEGNNVVDNERYQEVYQDLQERLRDWMKKTDDPLLKGEVDKPSGAVVNKRSCISPEEKNYE